MEFVVPLFQKGVSDHFYCGFFFGGGVGLKKFICISSPGHYVGQWIGRDE